MSKISTAYYIIYDVLNNGYWDRYQGLFRGPLYMTKYETYDKARDEIKNIPDYAFVTIIEIHRGQNEKY